MTILNQIKKHPFITPAMPSLRKLRRSYTEAMQFPVFKKEQKKSQNWSIKYNSQNHKKIEDALKQVKKNGGFFGGWAAAESALRAFSQLVLTNHPEDPIIVEFGSGQSTCFLNHLLSNTSIEAHTFEHHPYWCQFTRENSPGVDIHQTPLIQVSEDIKSDMFASPEMALELMSKNGNVLSEQEWDNTRTINAFYRADFEQYFEPQSINGVILDGPNGSGRSLCFPLIINYLAPQAIIFIDDYNHYPFLDDLTQLFNYNELHISHKLNKSWCILQITSRK